MDQGRGDGLLITLLMHYISPYYTVPWQLMQLVPPSTHYVIISTQNTVISVSYQSLTNHQGEVSEDGSIIITSPPTVVVMTFPWTPRYYQRICWFDITVSLPVCDGVSEETGKNHK